MSFYGSIWALNKQEQRRIAAGLLGTPPSIFKRGGSPTENNREQLAAGDVEHT